MGKFIIAAVGGFFAMIKNVRLGLFDVTRFVKFYSGTLIYNILLYYIRSIEILCFHKYRLFFSK